MNDTMGFAPIVNNHCVWHTRKGEQKFIELVEEKLETLLNEKIKLSFSTEMRTAIHNATISGICTDENINEAVTHVALVFRNRANMHRRLEHLRKNPIQNQPRGYHDRERGELRMQPSPQSSTRYEQFLDEQHKFR